MTKVDINPESTPEQDEIQASLEAASAALAKAASDRANRSQALKDAEAALSKISIKDFPELADSPIVQAFVKAMGVEDLAPGQSRNRGTLAEVEREWTARDMSQFPQVTFEPRETVPVTFNGLTYMLMDGVECTVPKPIKDIYDDHRKALRQAELHANYMQGYSDTPPDNNYISESTAKVRAFSQLGPRPDIRKRQYGPITTENTGSEG